MYIARHNCIEWATNILLKQFLALTTLRHFLVQDMKLIYRYHFICISSKIVATLLKQQRTSGHQFVKYFYILPVMELLSQILKRRVLNDKVDILFCLVLTHSVIVLIHNITETSIFSPSLTSRLECESVSILNTQDTE